MKKRGTKKLGLMKQLAGQFTSQATVRVAVLKTRPETVVEDYKNLMRMVGYDKFLKKENHHLEKQYILAFPTRANTTPGKWKLLSSA